MFELRAVSRRLFDHSYSFLSFSRLAVISICAIGLLSPERASAKEVTAIIGKDDRRLVPAKYDQLANGIGLLHDRSLRGARCTAFCIAPNMIATNSHCLRYRLVKRRKYDRDVRDFIFYLYRNGRTFKKEWLRFNRVIPLGDPCLSILSGDPPRGGKGKKLRRNAWVNSSNRDWAVARLWSNVCDGNELKFANPKFLTNKRALTKSPVFMIGFHGDTLKRDLLHRYSPCRITRVKGSGTRRTVEHNCDHIKTASGSPIFMNTAQGLRVVAINAGRIWRSRWKRIRGKKVTTWFWKRNLAALPLEFLPKLPRYQKIGFITEDLAMSELQRLLADAGHYRGRIDDKFGPATRSAIMEFERANGFVPLGIPTVETLKRLRGP